MTTQSDQDILDDEHPWPGLASFKEQDEHFFKGREADIEELYSLVNRERLTIIFAISGLGKSSLLQAGLFPRLRLERILPIIIRLNFTDASVSLREQVFSAIALQVKDKAIEEVIVAIPSLKQEVLDEFFQECQNCGVTEGVHILAYNKYYSGYSTENKSTKYQNDEPPRTWPMIGQ